MVEATELIRLEAVVSQVAAHRVEIARSFTLSVHRTPGHPGPTVEEVQRIVAAAFTDRSWRTRDVIDSVVTPGKLQYIVEARVEGSLAALLTLHRGEHPWQLLLHWLAVDERYRHQGVGEALVITAAQQAVSGGYSGLMLRTENWRQPALRLYRRLGFREVPDPTSSQRATAVAERAKSD